jgi:hypothetical protein
MRRCRIRTLVGLGLACLPATGCFNPVRMGAMWVGKKAFKEVVKSIHQAHDAKHAKDDETDSAAPASQPASAAEPSRRAGRH